MGEITHPQGFQSYQKEWFLGRPFVTAGKWSLLEYQYNNRMPRIHSRTMLRIVVVLMVGLIALGVRIYFADRHNVGDDEPTYLSNALDYANLIRTGQYPLVAWYQENYQHPVLSKILTSSTSL